METKSYLKNGLEIRNQEKEDKIRDYWNEAHLELRAIDSELATRCFSKAEYWTNPKSWNDEKINKYNITLDSLSDSLKQLEI
ncbi:hypothetical protein [Tenacibaculum retecalamus]|uniref:hypothetical protein n=1 Tax=Tenacibaculum retecalamus TaxID=3018315 RepID=UPI0023D8FCE3|nr:hypothetical protein [Tenacibaculum retecalamus]WBX70363.1 hypothetical protein PG912_08740 [Tenacibaculum retecalamus]